MSATQIVAAVLAIKAVLLALDPTIRFYLGDSAAFLYGALDDGRLPDDRSFTYSLLLRVMVRPFERLTALGIWQSAAGAAIAIALWRLLERRFGMPRAAAAGAACVLALEPAQLYYERMALAETFGLLAFVAFAATCVAYVATWRWWWIPIAAAVGLLAASLRLNYLPIVLVLSLSLPLLRLLGERHSRGATVRSLCAHVAIAVCTVALLHGAYRQVVGVIFGVPPSYLARAGFMELGLVVPLVKPHQLERVGLPPDLERHLQFPFGNPDARMGHMWRPGGLIAAIRARSADVESIARPLARLAISEDPLGVVRLGLHTLADYFREEEIQHALHNDLGRRAIPEPILWSLREHWRYDARDVPTRVSAVSWWFEHTTWWLVACLLALLPLSIANLLLHWRTPQRLPVLVVALIAAGLVLSHVLFVPVALYRYLHPLPFFVLLHAVPVAAAVLRPSRPHARALASAPA